jgi:hypothetical protein
VPRKDRESRSRSVAESEDATEPLTPCDAAAVGCVVIHRLNELVTKCFLQLEPALMAGSVSPGSA